MGRAVEPRGNSAGPFAKRSGIGALDRRMVDKAALMALAEPPHRFGDVAARSGFPSGEELGPRCRKEGAAPFEGPRFAQVEQVFALLRPGSYVDGASDREGQFAQGTFLGLQASL